jgi:hypothetical protein
MTPPHEDGTRINGELHLKWTIVAVPPSVRPPESVTDPHITVQITAQPERETESEDAEKVLGELYKRMSPEQRQLFLSKLPEKIIKYDEVPPQMQWTPRKVDRLQALALPEASKSTAIRTAAASRKTGQIRSYREAWCVTFNNEIPGVPNMCKETH